MTDLISDEDMIRQYLSSQPNHCFEILYKRYVNKVYRRCLSMTKDPLKAEDFTHDIFLKVFHRLEAFQERSSFSTWLYAISFNYCSDQIRLAKRMNFITVEEELDQNIPEPEDASVHDDATQLVNRIWKTLSTKERMLLQLKYEDELSVHDIANLYSLNPSTVKMRLKRSRDKIQQLYSKAYYD
ncbi:MULTISPECIES: sigma-70 family RNA polymerase sigma factor [unclassified Spirosoma]|uniref:RNA polymerase sigma factor n=1 Tax=unclassified Spirosoma TaxID=2621999 RepID=UPI0009612171|nr:MULTISPECIES: sigma-70 family RNA polymerase sigma factor [unclassified Spirosoma]MBN8821655.1 sigma-70 family RNA polymerase sigma factor [Spirosoma sp.]OJW80848.1 MAG: RNA polymerase subunit sigma-24 [Spirosoma sp. 48-14]